MAHFLEHMLFLGTGKYPDPGEYDRFITEHGGFSNARTAFAHTTYFFEVDAAHLEGALDRFAQFFITPRFDRGHLAGERRIVHSEFVSRTPERPPAEPRGVEAGPRPTASPRAIPRRDRGDARRAPRHRPPRRGDRLLRGHLFLPLDEARGPRPRAARRARAPRPDPVRDGEAAARGTSSHRRPALSGGPPSGAARHRPDPRGPDPLPLVSDPSPPAAPPVEAARPHLASRRPRRPGQPALGAQGSGVGGGVERGTRRLASGLRDVRDHDPGYRGGNRELGRGRRLGLRVPRPRPRSGADAPPSRRARPHGGARIPFHGEDAPTRPCARPCSPSAPLSGRRSPRRTLPVRPCRPVHSRGDSSPPSPPIVRS